jgi:hypothetical protein
MSGRIFRRRAARGVAGRGGGEDEQQGVDGALQGADPLTVVVMGEHLDRVFVGRDCGGCDIPGGRCLEVRGGADQGHGGQRRGEHEAWLRRPPGRTSAGGLAHGFDELAFGDGAGVVVDAGVIDRVKDLGTRVPQPRHTRVAGKLEQIQHSDRRFVLVVNGVSLRGVADDTVSPDDLAALFGQHVVVTGDVVFRPSGSVMRMDSVKLELAGEEASAWEKLPRPLFEQPVPTTRYRVAQTPDTGLAAIIGRWPGDETGEEIAAGLEAIA